jgi:nucleoside-diphosphate-sugar epimerase
MGKFLVTGGNGFIGYHICKELLKGNHEILSYDANRSWVSPTESLYPGYFQIRMNDVNKKIKNVIGDTTDRGKFYEVLDDFKPEYIIHLAALPLADVSNKYGGQAKSTILDSVEIVLDCVRSFMKTNSNFKRFTFASSSMVYGDFDVYSGGSPIPARETDKLDPRKSMYATYKAIGEMVVNTFGYVHGVPISIVRPSAVYGPTDSNRRVTEIFVNNALTGKPLELHQEGKSIFDFTYVKDTAHGFILASTHPNGEGETFNITAGHGRTLRELSDIICDIIPYVEVSLIKKEDKFRPSRGTLDITKAKTLLGYDPKFSLEDGMREYIKFVVSAGVLQGIKKEVLEERL